MISKRGKCGLRTRGIDFFFPLSLIIYLIRHRNISISYARKPRLPHFSKIKQTAKTGYLMSACSEGGVWAR